MDPVSSVLERIRQIEVILGDQVGRDATRICAACRYYTAAPVGDNFDFAYCHEPRSLDLVRNAPLPAITIRHNNNLCGAGGTWYIAR